MRGKTIQYAYDLASDCIVARCGNEYIWPVLDFEGMTPENGFDARYSLERVPSSQVTPEVRRGLVFSKKFPVAIKNSYREAFGMRPLPADGRSGVLVGLELKGRDRMTGLVLRYEDGKCDRLRV